MGVPKIKFWNQIEMDYYKSNSIDPEKYIELRGIKITKKIKKYISKWKKND